MLEEVARRGVVPDAASLRCPAPRDDDEARLQAAALARMCQALGGVPVVRRGPVTPRLLALLRGSPVKGCEDGGAVAARALALVPVDLAGPERGDAPPRTSRLELASAELSEEATDRLEASAYVDALELIERLGARGSAPSLSRALERRLDER
jgi:hypothetical protein